MQTSMTSSGHEERRASVGTITGRLSAGMRTFGAAVLAFAVITFAGGRAAAQDSVLPQALPEGNLVAVGVGATPTIWARTTTPSGRFHSRDTSIGGDATSPCSAIP